MAFSFGFGSSEADSDDGEGVGDRSGVQVFPAESTETANVPPRAHSLQELLASLPGRISYGVVHIESPLGRTLNLPRRDIYDVRAQLLGEGGQDEIVDRLDKSDISTGIYEGGFKTWECSVDLASLLLDRGPRKDIDELVRCDQIVELGAGSALPSLVLFQHAIRNAIPGLTFTLADYNVEVLRLVTLPNLLLAWAACADSAEIEFNLTSETSGDFEITPTVLQQFAAAVDALNMHINFISGSWSSSLADMVSDSAPDMGTVVLAAETIYSPAATAAFVEVLDLLLARVKMAKAIIGAKRMYFGVGGSVDGLKEACRERGMVAYEIENHGVQGMDRGVGRSLIEVQKY